MFKFLFGGKGAATRETQRQTIERTFGELNEILGGMAVKAKVGVDLETGLLEVTLPDQMPDEALALPAPSEEEVESASEDATQDAKKSVEKAAA
ncbi:MAG: hypothetical protein P8P66_06770 [Paracoccaceae bacterium]|jgi:hypothetical protein|nr:hypothetical protein [Paracoccaceae bacterium]MDG2452559.1 hypothetical protein [Paracoccaceae bacterium]